MIMVGVRDRRSSESPGGGGGLAGLERVAERVAERVVERVAAGSKRAAGCAPGTWIRWA